MDENTMVIAVVGITVSGLVIAVLGRAWLSRVEPPPPSRIAEERLENIEMRLVELQQAIDDVAIDIGRVAEGQQFTAKLLTERTVRDVTERSATMDG